MAGVFIVTWTMPFALRHKPRDVHCVDEPQQINFRPRTKECRVSRVTGTHWYESDQASAQEFWENLEWEEEPALVANRGQWAGLL